MIVWISLEQGGKTFESGQYKFILGWAIFCANTEEEEEEDRYEGEKEEDRNEVEWDWNEDIRKGEKEGGEIDLFTVVTYIRYIGIEPSTQNSFN